MRIFGYDKAFAFYWSSRTATTLAYQMLSVAVGWQVYALTDSALYLGFVGLAQFLPTFFLTLVIGHAADRYNRAFITCGCQLVQGLGALILAAGCYTDKLTTGSILAIMFVLGAARAFEGPTMQALLPNVVSAGFFPKAVAWSASSTQLAAIVGPALGGLLYAVSPTAVYGTVGGLFLGAGLFVPLIAHRRQTRQPDPVNSRSLFAGIAFIRSKPALLGAISLDLFAVLLGGATALLPIYAREILFAGPEGLGFLRAAPGIGALLTSVYLAYRPIRHRQGRTMFIAVIIFGVATTVFAVSTSFPLSIAALAILGAANVVSVVFRTALVQIETPDEMRGRVSAVNSLFTGTSNQLGDFESGVTAAWFGAVPSVLIGGIGTVAIAFLWMRLFPELARVDTLER